MTEQERILLDRLVAKVEKKDTLLRKLSALIETQKKIVKRQGQYIRFLEKANGRLQTRHRKNKRRMASMQEAIEYSYDVLEGLSTLREQMMVPSDN